MVAFKILAGGFDVFVATYLFNPDAASLTILGTSPTGINPSWLTLHPTNRSLLYAVNENTTGVGALQSFTITPNASLSPALDTVTSDGISPPFVAALSTGSVAVVNYRTGNGRIIPTSAMGTKFDDTAPVINFPSPANGASHPHMALELGDEVLIPDLGADQIWRMKQNMWTGEYTIQGSLPQPTGSGPRHIAFYNDRIFCLHELSSTLSVQTFPWAPNGTSTILDTVSIVPNITAPGAQWAAAEILIPRPSLLFPNPYIYVSNRNTGTQTPEGDSIAIFEHVDQGLSTERLVLVKQVFTGLDQIRGMEIGENASVPGGEEYLIAGGVAGNAGVVVYRRTDGGRNLVEVARNLDIPTRTTFVWL